MAESIEKLDRIVKVIMRPCPQLVVKHVVKLIRRNYKDNRKYNFAFEYDLPHFGHDKGLQFVTEDSILIESLKDEVKTQENGGVYKPKPQIFISYMEAPLAIMAFDTALSWLQGEDNKNIYISDYRGMPIKLGKTSSAVVPMSFNKVMILQPAIIYDDDKLSYQGIKIKCETGDIADLTAQEFFEFALALKYILMNLYTNSNILTLMGMSYWFNK